MSDKGVSECLGTMLIIIVLIIVAAGVSVYVMSITGDNIGEEPPQYAYLTTEITPALSAADTWEADSLKIEFTAGHNFNRDNSGDLYSGTEEIKFLLNDPQGNLHEAMQSLSMKNKTIEPGATFYFYTTSDNISARYYITDQYERISTDNTASGMPFLKPFTDGKWHVIIADDSYQTIIADREIVFS